MKHKRSQNLFILFIISVCPFMMPDNSRAEVEGATRGTELLIKDISAPYPKHCLDEQQWQGVDQHSPFNLLDNSKTNAWSPCSYAIKDGGYTLKIELEQTIDVDGISLSRVAAHEELSPSKRKKSRKAKEPSIDRHEIDTIQLLFFNYAISKKYPVYFQDVKFDGKSEIKISYQGMLNWNPRLLGEPMFDERRRALNLSSKGMSLPIKVDKIGIVFPQFDSNKAPPALRELRLFHGGKPYQAVGLAQSKQDYVEVMSQVYLLMVNGFMFVGEERAMVFAPTGTLWAMEGEETVAKVIGAWRFNKNRIEVDLSKVQKQRVFAKKKARLEKSRNRYFQALHLIVDEAPDRILVQSGPLKGEYQSFKVNSSSKEHKLDAKEEAPSFEMPE